jgi:hypothetical protein
LCDRDEETMVVVVMKLEEAERAVTLKSKYLEKNLHRWPPYIASNNISNGSKLELLLTNIISNGSSWEPLIIF